MEEQANSADSNVAAATPAATAGSNTTIMGFDAVLVKAVIISMVISAASVFIYDRYFAFRLDARTLAQVKGAQHIMKADFDKFVMEQGKLYRDGKLTDSQVVQNLKSYQDKLEAVPKSYVVFTTYKGDVYVRNAEEFKP